MKNPFLKLSIQIIGVFIVMMLVSLIPDYLRTFFDDEYCTGYVIDPITKQLENFIHYGARHQTPEWHWGYRHWLFLFMGICLLIVQICRIVLFINKTDFKNYNTKSLTH